MIILSSFYFIILFEYFSGTLGFKCMHKTTSNTYDDIESNDVNIIPYSQQTQHCDGYCYSYWKYDPNDLFNTSLYQLITSGCSNDVVDTDQFIINCNIIDGRFKPQQAQQCISSLKNLNFSNNTSLCCCYGDLCNIDYQIKFLDEILDSNDDALKEDYKNYTIFLIFVCFIFFTFSIISAKLLKSITTDKMLNKNNHYLHHQKRKTTDSLHLLESQPNIVTSKDTKNHHHPNFSSQKYLNDLIFIEIICHGKYGPIWKGKLNDTTVAIKVCSDSKQKHLWTNEYFIYSLPLMNHPNLPNFHRDIDRSLVNDHIENCLVIEYGHYGSLQSYLNEHTFNWSSMCQLFKSLVQGLSYLHTEIHEDGKFKPSIAHCSLSSANIIVKADGTCMICDFKYAVNLTNNGAADRHTVSEKSTNVRYLAPEILDESINYYHYTESALKQADVYSLGLILWEIASRCKDLYQGIDVPGYKLPYEHEIGLHPSSDQMKLLVNRHKARPLFPDIWKDSNYAIRLLKETINECWDHEPEARLTAFCIEERISELPLLWKRHKMETLSNCYIISFLQEHSKIKQMNVNGSDLSVEDQEKEEEEDEEEKEKENNSKYYTMNDKTTTNNNNHHEYSNNVCYINKFENSLHCKYNDHHHLLHPPQHKHYFHQISSLNNNNNHNNNNNNNVKKQHLNNNIVIVEKNFNMNSNNKCNNNNQQQLPQPKLTLPLQPYHARNPCMERNLMIEEDPEERDEILEQGLKFKIQNYNNANEMSLDTLSNEIDQNDTMIATVNAEMNYAENRSLIQAPNPIPFVQNYVHNNSGEAMIDVSSSSISPSIKIKDVNMYRNTNAKCRRIDNFLRLNIVNFLKRKFNLDLFNSNKKDCYPKCDDYNNSTNVDNNDIVKSKDSLSSSSSMSINNKSTILNSPSTTMISSGDNNNYPFSIHENQIIIDDSKFDKLNNVSSLSVGCVPYINNKLENNVSIINDNEYFIATSESSNNQPKMLQIVD